MVRRKSNNAPSTENFALSPAEYAMMMNANTQPLDEQPTWNLQLEASQRQPEDENLAAEEDFVRPMTPDLVMPAPEQAEQWEAAFKEGAPSISAVPQEDWPAQQSAPPVVEAPQQDLPVVCPPVQSPTLRRVGNLNSKPYWWTNKSRTLGFPNFCETMQQQAELNRVSARELEIIWQKLSEDERANFGDPVVIALVTKMWSTRCQITQPLGTAPPLALPVVAEEVAPPPVITSAPQAVEEPQATETPPEAAPSSLDTILKAACKTATAKLGVPKENKSEQPALSPKKSEITEPYEDVGLLLLSKLARLYFDESCYIVDKRSSSAALPKQSKRAKRIRTDNFAAEDDCKAVA